MSRNKMERMNLWWFNQIFISFFSVTEQWDNVRTPISINREENELIKALREIDPISRKEEGNT